MYAKAKEIGEFILKKFPFAFLN